MRFELGLEKPAANRAHQLRPHHRRSYIAGGLIPLLPYMLVADNPGGAQTFVVITLAALAIFGGLKGKLVGTGWLRSASRPPSSAEPQPQPPTPSPASSTPTTRNLVPSFTSNKWASRKTRIAKSA